MASKLSSTMTVAEFENGYWYREDLKDFGLRIGIPAAASLRKDELQRAIVAFLRKGTLEVPTQRALRKKFGSADSARGGLEDFDERGADDLAFALGISDAAQTFQKQAGSVFVMELDLEMAPEHFADDTGFAPA